VPAENLISAEGANWLNVAEGVAPGDGLVDAGTALLRLVLATPGAVWRQLDRGTQLDGLQVIARSQEPLQSQPLPGDIVVRIIEGGAGHASIVATPGIVQLQDLSRRGMRPDIVSSQGYVHVVEPTPFARRASDGLARGLTDSAGRVLEDLLLLRLATPPTMVTPPPEPTTRLDDRVSAASPLPESLGDPPPNLSAALGLCVAQTQALRNSLSAVDNPSRMSRLRIATETRLSVDTNPYAGFGRGQLESVLRAAISSSQLPETLLALWAKEGSLRMVTTATTVPGATTAENARALFRSNVYYVDLGSDHFVITRYDPESHDNVWDNRDSTAPKHEKHFQTRVTELFKAGLLSEDISSAINAELSVSPSAPFSVTPSIKFYALSLLLVDALFTRMQRNTFSQLSALSESLNYLQWNNGPARFKQFLASADQHRQEKEYRSSSGDPLSIEQWALHTIPKSTEWRQARTNAVRFMHYRDSYSPIFTSAMTMMRSATAGGPGAEALERVTVTGGAAENPTTLSKGSACAFFFKANRYLRYNIATDTVDVGPDAISRFWPHLPAEFQNNIGAAVNWGDGRVYFFKGNRYLRYNVATDRVDLGPVEISRYWTSLPVEFQSNIDAAVNWGDGHVYFFKGNRYLRYDIAADTVDVGPVEIARNWTSLPAEFQSNIDAAVNWGDGNAYFFKGSRYLRYKIAQDTVDVGPIEIARYWTSLPAEFRTNVRALINWTFPCDLAGLMRAAGLNVNEVTNWRTRKRPGSFNPIGIMMHHTAGTSSLNVVTNGRPDLAGPLANFHIEKSGLINIVSPGPSNHAGRGAQTVLDEVGRGNAPSGSASSRRLTDGPGGNSFFYGFENENLGDGVDPWPEAQLDAMAKAAAALCQLHCWDANRVISHKEWTPRKSDPTLNMDDFRARVARFF
jgi:hypothetical protein